MLAEKILDGAKTALLDYNQVSNYESKPEFIINNTKEGRTVLSAIEDQLLSSEEFYISVAFITLSGVTPLLGTLKELERRGVKGKILTTNYNHFTEPRAISKLHELKNLEIKMYDADNDTGFHTKGYIFKNNDEYRFIVGSSNLTQEALKINHEWNTKFVSKKDGELAKNILEEFKNLWDSKRAKAYDEFFEAYEAGFMATKKQKEITASSEMPSLLDYQLQPNSMQELFISNLMKLVKRGEKRALLISATGTGKTYAAAFAMREIQFKSVLFVVHRTRLANQAKASFERIFSNTIKMGKFCGGEKDYKSSYIFATVQSLGEENNYKNFKRNQFDCIILDEAHHSSADTYQKLLEYFTPKLWLGMTATPDRKKDDINGKNIYEIFDRNIACEIRLREAMEDRILCPFHYFGITDFEGYNGSYFPKKYRNIMKFDNRAEYIKEQASYFGYSGNRVKGLIFCRNIEEAKELSDELNALGLKTMEVDGTMSQEAQESAIERLVSDDESIDKLDYILSVDLLNEGVDIVEVNQVLLLRPTESPIVFIQQLGRGLRKASGKEFTVVIDFISNYERNFFIPVALSGDMSFNKDRMRMEVASGAKFIPGCSSIHFDEISKDRIFDAITKLKGIRELIKESFNRLEARLGRRPYLIDFINQKEIEPYAILKEYKSYHRLLLTVDKLSYRSYFFNGEDIVLEYLSKTIASGLRNIELIILKKLLSHSKILILDLKYSEDEIKEAVRILQLKFVGNSNEAGKYNGLSLIRSDNEYIYRTDFFNKALQISEFKQQVEDLVEVSLIRYNQLMEKKTYDYDDKFIQFEKYTRRDVSYLMNFDKDLSSTMYGKYRKDDDVYIFVTYKKIQKEDGTALEGKPIYADEFTDSVTFKWDSQIGRGKDSQYVKDVMESKNRYLFVQKTAGEGSFYYMGKFDLDLTAENYFETMMLSNDGTEKIVTKMTFKMRRPISDDILLYLRSNVNEKERSENEED